MGNHVAKVRVCRVLRCYGKRGRGLEGDCSFVFVIVSREVGEVCVGFGHAAWAWWWSRWEEWVGVDVM